MKRLRVEQDIQPLSAFRSNAAKLIGQVQANKRALVLTQRGRSAAVVLDASEYDRLIEELELLQDVHLANNQIAAGKAVPEEEEEESDEEEEAGPLGLTDLSSLNLLGLEALMEKLAPAAPAGTAGSARAKRTASEKARFHLRETNAATFVFPDGSTGGKVQSGKTAGRDMARSGLGRYVYSPRPNEFVPTREFVQAINSIDKLKKHSSIIGSIVEDGLLHPGRAFVSTSKVEGGGAIVTGIAYQVNGFARFNEKSSVFGAARPGAVAAVESDGSDEEEDDRNGEEGTGLEQDDLDAPVGATRTPARRAAPEVAHRGGARDSYEVQGLCGATRRAVDSATRTIRIRPGRRYALLTRHTTDAQREAMLELWASPENLHGEYLQVIIGSPVARDGINLPETIRMHVTAGWNASGTNQAIGRINRSNAYVLLSAEARALAIAEGRDPDTAQVEVAIFKHAALSSNEEVPSVDLILYAGSERKDRSIKRIERFMMQSAFDCHLHYGRNVRKTDVDGSAACAYGTCEYECAVTLRPEEKAMLAMPPGDRPLTAMVLTLSSRRLAEIGDQIVEQLVQNPTTRVDRLASVLAQPIEWINVAVDQLARSRRVVLDGWGFPCRVVAPENGGGIVALHRGMDSRVDIFDGYYAGHLSVVSAHTPIGTTMVPTDERDLDLLPAPRQMERLEGAVARLATGKGGPADWEVVAWWERYFYAIRRPDTDLARAAQALEKRGTGRGRKAKIGAELRLHFEIGPSPPILTGAEAVRAVIDQCTSCSAGKEVPWVLLHILDSKSVAKTAYSISSQIYHVEGRIRIWDEAGKRWLDTTLDETPVYRELIQRARDALYASYGQVFGSVFEDKQFRIHDQRATAAASAPATGQKRNRRQEARGKVCKSWPLEDLISVAGRTELRPSDVPIPAKLSAAQGNLVADRSGRVAATGLAGRIEWAWWTSLAGNSEGVGAKTAALCDAIEAHFREQGKLDVV